MPTLQHPILYRLMKPWFALLLLGLISSATAAFAQDFDILITGGRIADGTGNPSYQGDVGIRAGRIAAVGRLAGRSASRTIDATGLVVAPGFVDIHNHSDYTLVADGDAQSMVRQGVTTMIFGEGGSAAPVGGKQERGRDRADWTDFQGYFAKLLKQGISTNIGTYVGSSQIWTYVRGEKAGPPTPEEVKQMQAQVEIAMKQGALGVASSLSGPPGSWIDTDTLVAMCEVAGRYGGIYSTHMRTEGRGVFESVAEAIEIGRRAQRAGGHHPSQDRRARDVGPDAGAGRVDRERPRPGAGSGGERLPVSRRPEQPVRASFRLGRMRAARRR